MPLLQSCKDCYKIVSEDGKLKYQIERCPFEHANDYKDTHDFFKNKYGEDFPQLLAAAQALLPQVQACRAERNAAMPALEQKAMMNQMMSQMNETIKEMHSVVDAFIGKASAKKQTTAIERKPSANPSNPANNGLKMWRPDIKEEKVQDAIDKLKAQYPNLQEEDIKITTNTHGNMTIRFKSC